MKRSLLAVLLLAVLVVGAGCTPSPTGPADAAGSGGGAGPPAGPGSAAAASARPDGSPSTPSTTPAAASAPPANPPAAPPPAANPPAAVAHVDLTDPAKKDLAMRRVDTEQRVFLQAGNLDLRTPLSWRVYGDPYTAN